MWGYDDHGLLRRKNALESGISRKALDSAVASVQLVRVLGGFYIDASSLAGLPAYKRNQVKYRLGCLAAAGRSGRDRLMSHESAAAMHGLELLSPDRSRVHFTSGKPSGGRVKGRVAVVHAGKVPDSDIVDIDGMRVTSLERTAVDIALRVDFKRALAVFDAALARGAELDDLTERLKLPRVGVAGARYALRHANGLSANPGESWCRAQMIEAGLPTPELQKTYYLSDGSRAEVDYDFDQEVVVEFDGLVKYGPEYLGAGEVPADILIKEKRREDGLRELGLDVVRIVYADLRHGRMVLIVRRHLVARGVIAA